MPPNISAIYIQEKYVDETKIRYYVTDMLWASANGKQYKNAKKYSELDSVAVHEPQAGGDEIMSEIVNAW